MGKFKEVDLNAATESQSGEGNSEVQLATAYIIYMMIGSYFKSCKPLSKIRINSLFVHYADMRVNSQFSVERRVEWEFTEHFSDYIPLFNESICEAGIREDKDKLYIDFNTGLEKLTAAIDAEGKYEFTLS
ncbi:MAG: hypothetical protein IJ123_08045 [Blautia sp.]|nr:hypothetical protein [Blautia sp.]